MSLDYVMKLYVIRVLFFIGLVFKNSACLPVNVSITLCLAPQDIKQVIEKAFVGKSNGNFIKYKLVFVGGPPRLYRELYAVCEAYWSQNDTKKALTETLFFLKRKKTIQSVRVSFLMSCPGQCIVVCELESPTILRFLRFKGMLRGKDMYRHYYMMHVGDPFVTEKHDQSIERIKLAMYEQGYKKATVMVDSDYDEDDKSIALQITCNRGQCHTISQVDVSMEGLDGHIIEANIKKEAQLFLKKHLCKKKYSLDLLNNQTILFKQFLMKKGFFKVKITVKEKISKKSADVALSFLLESDYQKVCVFRGNRFFSDDFFLKKLKVFSDVMHSVPASLLVQELSVDYLKKGFFNVSIAHDDHINKVTFFIAEGARFKVRDIVIKGSTSYKASFLKHTFFYRTLHRHYDEDILKGEIDRLSTYLQGNGFLHSTVTKRIVDKDDSKGTCVVNVYVQEQKAYYVSHISIQEPFEHLLSKGSFRRYFKTKKRIPFSQKMIIEQQQWLIDYFRKEGFLNVRVAAEKKEIETGYVIHWKIDQGKKVSFGSIIIDGYTVVPYETLCQTISLDKGLSWNKDKMRSMYESLKNLDIFKHVALISENSLLHDDVRDVVLRLEDNYSLEGRIRLGFQQMSKNLQFKNGSTYKVGGTVLYRNLQNCADSLRLDADVTRFERAIGLAYHVPVLFEMPVKTIFKGYVNKYIQPIAVGVNKPLYEAQERGFFISCAGNYKRLDSALTTGCEWSKTKDLSLSLARAIHFEPILIDKAVPAFFMETTSFFDWLDNTLQPSKGMYGVLTAKGLVPFKTGVSFIRCLLESGIFFPIIPDTKAVVALRLRAGHIFTPDFIKMMPADRFYLGGSTTIRGYQQDECPPLGLYEDNGKDYFVPQGGSSVACANIELRIPFVSQYGGVIFHDIGTLAAEGLRHSFASGGKYYCATGCGFRYETPLSVFRFDIGWKWQKQYPQEKNYAWFLAFGQAF